MYALGDILQHFVAKHNVRDLNVAGPRASKGGVRVIEFTTMVLEAAFGSRAGGGGGLGE